MGTSQRARWLTAPATLVGTIALAAAMIATLRGRQGAQESADRAVGIPEGVRQDPTEGVVSQSRGTGHMEHAHHVPSESERDQLALACRRGERECHVSLVIPAMNEEHNLPWVLTRIPEIVDELILVDGHSEDRTVEVARTMRPDVRVVTQPGRGKGDALRAGFAATTGDFIVMLDADGSMDPGEIPACVAALEDRRSAEPSGEYQLVKGSRFLAGGGSDDIDPLRRLGNGALRGLVNALYSADFTDLCYGLIAFRRDQLAHLDLSADGFEIETEIIVRGLKAGVRIGEVASFERQRLHGESNLRTWRDGTRVLVTLMKERFRRAGQAANGHAGNIFDGEVATELAS